MDYTEYTFIGNYVNRLSKIVFKIRTRTKRAAQDCDCYSCATDIEVAEDLLTDSLLSLRRARDIMRQVRKSHEYKRKHGIT